MEEQKAKPKVKKSKYGEDVKKKAKEMFAAGKKLADIAKEIGCGRSAVRRWIK